MLSTESGGLFLGIHDGKVEADPFPGRKTPPAQHTCAQGSADRPSHRPPVRGTGESSRNRNAVIVFTSYLTARQITCFRRHTHTHTSRCADAADHPVKSNKKRKEVHSWCWCGSFFFFFLDSCIITCTVNLNQFLPIVLQIVAVVV